MMKKMMGMMDKMMGNMGGGAMSTAAPPMAASAPGAGAMSMGGAAAPPSGEMAMMATMMDKMMGMMDKMMGNMGGGAMPGAAPMAGSAPGAGAMSMGGAAAPPSGEMAMMAMMMDKMMGMMDKKMGGMGGGAMPPPAPMGGPSQGSGAMSMGGATAPPSGEMAMMAMMMDKMMGMMSKEMGGMPAPAPMTGAAPSAGLASTGLRDHHATHRLRPVRLILKLLREPRQPLPHTPRFDLFEVDAIDARCPFIGLRQGISMRQDVDPTDLVVEQVEAVARLRLGLHIELALERLDLFAGCQAHRQSLPTFHSVANVSEAGASPSTGITRLRQYCGPLRLPLASVPCQERSGRYPDLKGSLLSPINPSPACCCHYPGGPDGCTRRSPSPSVGAFPELGAGRRPRLAFSRPARRLHVTACRIARPPTAAFVTRRRPGSCPPTVARQLPSPIDIGSCGLLLPQGL